MFLQATQEEGIQGSHGGRICLYYRFLTGNEVRLCKGQIGLGLSAETRVPKRERRNLKMRALKKSFLAIFTN